MQMNLTCENVCRLIWFEDFKRTHIHRVQGQTNRFTIMFTERAHAMRHAPVVSSAASRAVDGRLGSGRHALVALGKYSQCVNLVDEVRDGAPHAEAQACGFISAAVSSKLGLLA